MSNIEPHEYEDEIICPHCLKMQSDPWEYPEVERKTIECGWCSKEFALMVEVKRTYSTFPICKNIGGHKWEDVPGHFNCRICDQCGELQFKQEARSE